MHQQQLAPENASLPPTLPSIDRENPIDKIHMCLAAYTHQVTLTIDALSKVHQEAH